MQFGGEMVGVPAARYQVHRKGNKFPKVYRSDKKEAKSRRLRLRISDWESLLLALLKSLLAISSLWKPPDRYPSSEFQNEFFSLNASECIEYIECLKRLHSKWMHPEPFGGPFRAAFSGIHWYRLACRNPAAGCLNQDAWIRKLLDAIGSHWML